MSVLPPSSDLVNTGISKATFKAALSQLRSYLAGVTGTLGTQSDALTTMGVPMSSSLTKTGAYTLTTADRGKVIFCTGTWTLSLPAASSLGDGFVFGVWNNGTGVITIDPYLSELIDAGLTKIIKRGALILVFCNGSSFRSVGQDGSSQMRLRTIKYSMGYSPDVDVISFLAMVYGAIGGQSGGTSASGRGGRGGAGYSEKLYSNPSGTYSCVIGAAGSTSGTAGGTTSFDVVSVTGSGGVTSTGGGSGGVGSGGDFNATGGSGGAGATGFGGGGGGAASRAGNGGNGSAASASTRPGAGGGTGGNNASGATEGAAAASLAAGIFPIPLIENAFTFYGGIYGSGAKSKEEFWTDPISGFGSESFAPGGGSPNGTTVSSSAGSPGEIQILEFLI